MTEDAVEATDSKGRWASEGCLTFVVIYGLCLVIMYLTSTPTQTETFVGRTAHEFTIAGVVTGKTDGNDKYRVFNLERLRTGTLDLADITFLLPEKSISIYVGDIHSAEILEDHGEWQLVAFHYSNTRTSTSIYRAYEDRIEPVSYQLTSSVGHVFGAMMLFIPALLASAVVTALLRLRARRMKRAAASNSQFS